MSALTSALLALAALMAPVAADVPTSPTAPPAASTMTAITPAMVAVVAADQVEIEPDDVDAEADYRLTVDGDEREIDVEVVIDVTFRKPNERTDTMVFYYYLTEWFAVVPSAATDLTVLDSVGALSFEVAGEETAYSVISIDLRRNLFNGASAELLVTYSLPDDPPPLEVADTAELYLEDQVVVNDATAGWMFFSDPGLDRWEATVELPEGFEPSESVWAAGFWTLDASADVPTLSAEGSEFAYDYLVLEYDEAMVIDDVAFDGHSVTVRSWPGDTAWRDRITDEISTRLPVLIDLLGLPWPDRPLVVQESAETLGTSYGGWYANDEHTITIGPTVDDELILHELSHVWFNYGALQDRWLVEGLAEEYAWLAADDGGDEPPPVSTSDAYARPLQSWSTPNQFEAVDPDAAAAEQWGYDASWYTIRQVRELLGTEAFTAMVTDLMSGGRSYPGPATEERADAPGAASTGSGQHTGPSWLEFLDLAADHGSADDGGEGAAPGAPSRDEALSELFADWVEGEWTSRFERRAEARSRYRELVERAGGWTLPELVRRPMRDWHFVAAGNAMDRTDAFLDVTDGLAEDLARHDMSLPNDAGDHLAESGTVEDVDRYEADLTAATGDVVRFLDQAETVGPVERVGLLGSGLNQVRSDSVEAYESGRLDAAAESVERGQDLLSEAHGRGVLRLGLLVAALVVIALAVGLMLRRRRRSVRGPVIDLRPGAGVDSGPSLDSGAGLGTRTSPDGVSGPDGADVSRQKSSEDTTTSQRS